MRALPADLITILEPCLKVRATHVDVTEKDLVLFKGEQELGRGENPAGFLPYFTEVVTGMSTDVDGEHRKAEFHTPLGVLFATIRIEPHSLRMEFASDSPAYIATRFDQLLHHAVQEGAQQVAFTPKGVPIFKDGEVILLGEMDEAHMPAFIAHARALAGMKDGENTGATVLVGSNSKLLRIEIAERNGQQGVIVNL